MNEPTTPAVKPPICPYCDRKAEAVLGIELLPQHPHLWGRAFWRCVPCGAYVGTHEKDYRDARGTEHRAGEPFGRLANAELRRLRQQAHQSFDPLWLSGRMKRARAYRLLAEMMRLPIERCHIGDFNEVQCRRVIEICRSLNRKQRSGS